MANIPPILKHMTLAIFNGGSLHGTIQDRFRHAFDIAVAQCKKYGYITGGGTEFKVTAKGLARKHEAEGMMDRGRKAMLFEGMFFAFIDKKALKEGQKLPGEPREAPNLDGHILGNQGFPKEAPHAAEPLYAHWHKWDKYKKK